MSGKGYSLSEEDILNIIKKNARVLSYRELKNYDTIEEAMGPEKILVLLYETRDNYGHWVAVFDRGEHIEFFDSYGDKPDDQIAYIPEYFRRSNGLDYPHLTYLLYKSGRKIEYNDHKLQKKGNNINTCGRWVAMRIEMRDDHINTFAKNFNNVYTKSGKKISPDDVVTFLTDATLF